MTQQVKTLILKYKRGGRYMENEEQQRSKVVKVKQSFDWYVVFDYLQLLTGCLEAMSDKEFNKNSRIF